jgi:hypothetical protein
MLEQAHHDNKYQAREDNSGVDRISCRSAAYNKSSYSTQYACSEVQVGTRGCVIALSITRILLDPNWGEGAFNHLTYRCLFVLEKRRKWCPNAVWSAGNAGVRDRITRFASDSGHSRVFDCRNSPIDPRATHSPFWREVLHKLRPEPVREPLPPPLHYEGPSRGRYRRRR